MKRSLEKYQTQWQFGYTLGPPSEATRGNYTLIGPVNSAAQANNRDTNGGGPSACEKLRDLASYNRLQEAYSVTAESATSWTSTLSLGVETYTGRGASAETARENAALQALTMTSLPSKSTMKARPMAHSTATMELHELATKKGVRVDFSFVEPPGFVLTPTHRAMSKKDLRSRYTVRLSVAGAEFFGQSDLPMDAKHSASSQALSLLSRLPDPPSGSQGSSAASASAEKNPIMTLNEIAMVNQLQLEWIMSSESGPPHMRSFEWRLRMGQFEAAGAGANKKIARTAAAQKLLEMLPPEMRSPPAKKPKKRASVGPPITNPMFGHPFWLPSPFHPVPAPSTAQAAQAAQVSQPSVPAPVKVEDSTPKIVQMVIRNPHPISALHEYCKKVKIPDPDFECVEEKVLETWTRGDNTYKKLEFTFRLEVAEKTFFASANTKKEAKNRAATEAWNYIRVQPMPN